MFKDDGLNSAHRLHGPFAPLPAEEALDSRAQPRLASGRLGGELVNGPRPEPLQLIEHRLGALG